MLEGLFQPLHLIILLITVLIGAGGLFLLLRVLWPLVRFRKVPHARGCQPKGWNLIFFVYP